MDVILELWMGLTTRHVISYQDNPNIMAQASALQAFKSLQQDAKKHGFDMQICSGFRSFDRQAQIVEAKFTGKRQILDLFEKVLDPVPEDPVARLQAILVFSALPGFSRHHFGSDFDIYAYNLLPKGQNLQLTYHEYLPGAYFYEFGEYLKESLCKFDFINPYNNSDSIFKLLGLSNQENINPSSMGYEPWHISYVPAAEPFLKAFDYQKTLDYVTKTDFLFAPYVAKVMTEYKSRQVLGLN